MASVSKKLGMPWVSKVCDKARLKGGLNQVGIVESRRDDLQTCQILRASASRWRRLKCGATCIEGV
jgi:hypothetical protein